MDNSDQTPCLAVVRDNKIAKRSKMYWLQTVIYDSLVQFCRCNTPMGRAPCGFYQITVGTQVFGRIHQAGLPHGCVCSHLTLHLVWLDHGCLRLPQIPRISWFLDLMVTGFYHSEPICYPVSSIFLASSS